MKVTRESAKGDRFIFPRNCQQGGRSFPQRNGSRPGRKQIQIEDPDGNPIELFEPRSDREQIGWRTAR
jgi:hypothetical protein